MKGSVARRRMLQSFAAVATLLLLVAIWSLTTSSGARFLLARADAAMPATLTVRNLDGSVLGGLRMGGFRFDDDGVRLDAERLEVDLRVMPLLARRLDVDRIFVDGGTLKLWPARNPDKEPATLELPLRLKLDEVMAKDFTIVGLAEEPIELDTLAFAGTWIGTHVRLERLVVTAPQGRIAFKGDINLANLLAIQGHGTMAWESDGIPWRAALATRKHPSGTGLGVAVTAPLRAEVTALLAGTHQDPRWEARLRVPEQVLSSALTGGVPTRIALDLRGGGRGFTARVAGNGNYAGEPFSLSEGRLRSTPATVFIDALELALPARDARVRLSGKVARGGKRPDADLELAIVRLPLPQGEDSQGPPTVLDGRAALRGWLDGWSADARVTATRERLSAAIEAKLRGNPRRVLVDSVRVDSSQGALALSGEVGLIADAPWRLRGSAKNFDPAIFLPAWPGAIDATVAFDGKRGKTQPVGTLLVSKLGGTLRDRSIAGEAHIEFGEDARFAGDGSLRSGQSRVEFDKARLDDSRVALKLDVRSLADLLPNARGRIVGDLVLDIEGSPPSIDGHVTASDVVVAKLTIGALELDARAPRGSSPGHLTLSATSLMLDRLRVDRLDVDARGTASKHSATLALDGSELDVTARAEGGFANKLWQGRLLSLELAPRDLERWTLQRSVALAASSDSLSMDEPGVCVSAGDREACVDLDFAKRGELAARWRVDRLPSAIIARALELAGVAAFEIDAELSSQGTLARTAGGALSGSGNASLSDGRIVVRRDLEPIEIAVRDLRLDFDADGRGLRARINGGINESGRITGNVSTGAAPNASSALAGDIALEFDELSWLEALNSDIANPRGTFNGRFVLGGTLGAPSYSGQGHLRKFYVEIPEYNLRLRKGDVRLTANADRSLAVEGTVLSGRGGSARFEGRWAPGAAGEQLRLKVTGDNFLAANRPDLMLRVTPDLTITATSERIDVTGTVQVPRARIDMSRIETERGASADVVVIDDPVVEQTDSPVWSDITVVAGDKVALEGFGLDGLVTGQVRVRNRPGRETTGQGTLSVLGKYDAYGQRLDIDRGRVIFNRSALDNPRLDIRATKRVGAVTVGIKVAGTAQAPDSQVYSSPAMDQSDALAYLIVGRPLRSASSADAGQIANAAGSLGGASGDLLAKSLGARMGLGDLGESTAAFTMGRWLSPRLYLSYGISGIKGEPVFSLRYLLREWLELETVVGTEVRAGVNYRRER